MSTAPAPPACQKVEESYREYHKTAISAAAIHPSEAAEEAQKVRGVICSLLGLSLPPPANSEDPASSINAESVGEESMDAEKATEETPSDDEVSMCFAKTDAVHVPTLAVTSVGS